MVLFSRFELTRWGRGPVLRGALVTLAFGCALSACAAQTDPGAYCNAKSIVCAQSGGGTSSGGTSSSSAGTSSTSGGSSTAGGTGPVTTAGSGGAVTSGGSGGTTAIGGTGGTTPTAGTGGGAPAGGSHAGGAGGAVATGGGGATSTGGSGGSANAACTAAIPAQATWAATASVAAGADPASLAIDADLKTRYSTGTKMLGAEWLQVDLGAAATVNQVTVTTSNNDYGRHLKVRMPATSGDQAAAVLAEKDVTAGGDTVFTFPVTSGRYILISQTGMLATGETAWWSVNNVGIVCQ